MKRNERNSIIEELLLDLYRIAEQIETLRDNEQDELDEQSSEVIDSDFGDNWQYMIDSLENAKDSIDQACDELEEAKRPLK